MGRSIEVTYDHVLLILEKADKPLSFDEHIAGIQVTQTTKIKIHPVLDKRAHPSSSFYSPMFV